MGGRSVKTKIVDLDLTSKSLWRNFLNMMEVSDLSRSGLKMLMIGTALSTSRSLVKYVFSLIRSIIITFIKRTFVYTAIFNGEDEAYRWMLLFMASHPNFKKSSIFEVSVRPPLLLEIHSRGHGSYDEGSTSNKDQLPDFPNSKTEKKHAGYFLTPADREVLQVVCHRSVFWVNKYKRKCEGGGCTEHISVTYLSLSPATALRRVLQDAREQYQAYSNQRVSYYRFDSSANWDAPIYKSKRSLESVHLPDNKKHLVLEDARNFFSKETQRKYQNRNIPWRRGYLFHGLPGTGKSTLCHVLASELGVPIYEINLNHRYMDDVRFVKVMSLVPSRSIVLIEDIDAAFVKRREAMQKNTELGKIIKGETNTSFSALLNAIDGLGATEGRLLCITSNYKSLLDPALLRSGRIDFEIEFVHATRDQAKEMFLRFYSAEGESSARIEKQAEKFASLLLDKRYTISALQNYFLGNIDDPHAALDGIKMWCEEQDEDENRKPFVKEETIASRLPSPKQSRWSIW